MEDRTFFSIVKFILILYNLLVSAFWFLLLMAIIDAFIHGKKDISYFEGGIIGINVNKLKVCTFLFKKRVIKL